MLKFLVLSVVSFFAFSAGCYASCHVSECPDQDFIDLGKRYPSVGYFSTESGVFGSGTLVDVGIESLKGRVVVTCAHIFVGARKKKILFSIQDFPSCCGQYYIHPRFEEYQRECDDICHDSFDIGIFILEEPLCGVSSSCLDLETSYGELLEASYICVGYGHTGHILGKYRIIDGSRRASYADAHASDNPEQDQNVALIRTDASGAQELVSYVIEKDSILRLTPSVFSREMNESSCEDRYMRPSGIARSGDSGGACFGVKGQKLIGIISGGSADVYDFEYVLEEEYFFKYQKKLEETITRMRTEYEDKLDDLGRNDPEMLGVFLQENSEPKMPCVIKASELDVYIGQRCEETFRCRQVDKSQSFQTINQIVVLVSFHTEWMRNLFDKVLE